MSLERSQPKSVIGESLVPGCEFSSCPIHAATGEPLGVVQDFLLDASNGRIVCVVVRRSDGPHVDHRLVAVPWLKVHWEPRKDCLVLEGNPEELRQLPQFDRPPEPDQPGWREVLKLHRQSPAPGDF